MPKPWLACLAAVCAADAAAATRLHIDLVAYEARNVELELRADGKAPYEVVAQVMAALSSSGFTKINLITDTGGPSSGAVKPPARP